MYEMTLDGLLRLGNSWFAENEAQWLVIKVEAYGNAPETIINPKENFETKLAYYKEAYNDDLTLKANPNIKIVGYDMLEDIRELNL